MTRKLARSLVGNQPTWALRNTARALQLQTWRNTGVEWRRLAVLRALGYKVTVAIPEWADR